MAVLAIGRDYSVRWCQDLHRAGSNCLLADVKMQKTAYLLLLIQLRTFLLEAANAHHRAQQRHQVLASQIRLCRFGVVHDERSAIIIG